MTENLRLPCPSLGITAARWLTAPAMRKFPRLAFRNSPEAQADLGCYFPSLVAGLLPVVATSARVPSAIGLRPEVPELRRCLPAWKRPAATPSRFARKAAPQ